jgi:glycyl-tRNA synthetase beta chain
MSTADFLVELGTEELPPNTLNTLMQAFADEVGRGLDEARLEHGEIRAYASPRRLAVIVDELASAQASRDVQQKGPPVKIAFDDAGEPAAPALAFARKCGVDVATLDRVATEKGEWLVYNATEEGRSTADLIGPIVSDALNRLPIARRMRWGDGDAEFVRPVHWLVMLHGEDVVETSVLGLASGRQTRGHRFHSPEPFDIPEPSRYVDLLESRGRVVVDVTRRRKQIEAGVALEAASIDGVVMGGDALFDEVTALVEWPVPLLGRFEASYLELPREVVISTLTGHQRYFPIANAGGELMNAFVTVANLDSKDPAQVRDGNERVIRPRLADAAFFWDSDRKSTLASRVPGLDKVVYQQGLGSLGDKSRRVEAVARHIAAALGHPDDQVARAATLAKCDLSTGMVGEFPELQGTMGAYYAQADGEPAAVSTAIREQYLPRFAGDVLPATRDGQILALADRLDTLAGIFALGKRPSGNRDPFGLRRAALGVVRLLIECELEVDIKAAIACAVSLQPTGDPEQDLVADIYGFIAERLRRYFQDRDTELATTTLDAVMARQPVSLLDFAHRLAAVKEFLALEEAESLAAANKRIANILKKSDEHDGKTIDASLFDDVAETELHAALQRVGDIVRPMLAQHDYTEALRELAALKQPIDRFFDDVMVMTDDEAVRANRLVLLGELRTLFLGIADVSRLSAS